MKAIYSDYPYHRLPLKQRVFFFCMKHSITYARNIIQWNLNLFMNDDKDDEELQYDKRNFGK